MATSTTTTINDVIHSQMIDPIALDYLSDIRIVDQFFAQYSIEGQATNTYQLWKFQSNLGTAGNNGVGFDTEFDATEASDLASTTLSTDAVTISSTEYGANFTVTDNVLEDGVGGAQFLNQVIGNAMRILMTAFEKDEYDLFSSLATTSGSTGVDLTLANMMTCVLNARTNGVNAPDGLVFCLDEQQGVDYENALIATNAAAAVYAGSADRALGVDRDPNNGLTNGRIGVFRGYGVYVTGMAPTANAGADVVGACFVPWTPANRGHATFGAVTKRPFRIGSERDESLRATEIIATMRRGAGEQLDLSGTRLVTDA